MIQNLLFKNKFIICLIVTFVVSGVALVHVGQEVYKKKKTNKTLQKNITKVEKEIASLHAEIAFLSSPQRLDKIVSAVNGKKDHSNIKIVKNDQYIKNIELVRMVKPIQKPLLHKASLRKKTVEKTQHKKQRQVVEKKNIEITPSIKQSFSNILDHVGGYEQQ